MSNYEQMELNITLDGERELKENVMLSQSVHLRMDGTISFPKWCDTVQCAADQQLLLHDTCQWSRAL